MEPKMVINCLFVDLGNVLFKIDHLRANKNLANLGLRVRFAPDNDPLYPAVELLEVGSITPEKLLEMEKNQYQVADTMPDDNIIIATFNSILDPKGFMVDRLQYLKNLKERAPELKIYLLSNTNEIHIKYIHDQAKEQGVNHLFGDDKSNGLFTDRLFSCRLKARKPEPLIFLQACDIAGTSPNDCLFIDDNHENILSAMSLGINTIELKTTDLNSFANAVEEFISR